MTVKTLDLKEDQARHVAMLVVEYQDTDVTHSTVEGWTADGVYEWIESWNYVYEDGEWFFDDSE